MRRTAGAATAVQAHGLPTLCRYIRGGRARVPERLSSGHRPCTVRCDRLGRARPFVCACRRLEAGAFGVDWLATTNTRLSGMLEAAPA